MYDVRSQRNLHDRACIGAFDDPVLNPQLHPSEYRRTMDGLHASKYVRECVFVTE